MWRPSAMDRLPASISSTAQISNFIACEFAMDHQCVGDHGYCPPALARPNQRNCAAFCHPLCFNLIRLQARKPRLEYLPRLITIAFAASDKCTTLVGVAILCNWTCEAYNEPNFIDAPNKRGRLRCCFRR